MPLTRRHLVKMTPLLLACPARAARIESVGALAPQPGQYPAWPTLVRRKNGELIVAYSGSREAHIDPFGRVEIMRSSDEGRTWSWPQVVMDTPIDDRDAGILETPRGTLLINTFTSLAYEKLHEKASDWPAERRERWDAAVRGTSAAQKQALLGAWMLRSTDGGVTWSAPYRVDLTSPHGPFALRDGRLLHAGKRYPGAGEIGVSESRDDGLSWRWLAGIPTRPGDEPLANYHELHGVETAEGRIVVHIRNHNAANARETLQTESADGGKTWSVPRPIGVWGLPSHLIRLQDGRLLMSYSYRRAPRGNQARVSQDHGRTWSAPIVLSDDGTGDLGYPSTVEVRPGRLLSLWYDSTPEHLSRLRLARWSLDAE